MCCSAIDSAEHLLSASGCFADSSKATAAASASALVGEEVCKSKYRAALPATSRKAGMSEQSTRAPHCSASTASSPKPSMDDGAMNSSQFAQSHDNCGSVTPALNTTCPCNESCPTIRFRRPVSGP